MVDYYLYMIYNYLCFYMLKYSILINNYLFMIYNYLCFYMLKYIILTGIYRFFIYIILIYLYMFTTFVINSDIQFTAVQEFLDSYEVCMNPNPDNGAGSSSMGSAGGAPNPNPQWPGDDNNPALIAALKNAHPYDPTQGMGNEDQGGAMQDDRVDEDKMEEYNVEWKYQDNRYSPKWEAKEVVKKPEGWFDRDGVEVCPDSKKAILPNGNCPTHNTMACDSNTDTNQAPKLQGVYDPVKGLFVGRTLRERIVNNNLKYYKNYKESFQRIYNRPWSFEDEYEVAKKIERFKAGHRRVEEIRIRDINLNSFEKAFLRERILKIRKLGPEQERLLRDFNIDNMFIKGKISREFSRFYNTKK